MIVFSSLVELLCCKLLGCSFCVRKCMGLKWLGWSWCLSPNFVCQKYKSAHNCTRRLALECVCCDLSCVVMYKEILLVKCEVVNEDVMVTFKFVC